MTEIELNSPDRYRDRYTDGFVTVGGLRLHYTTWGDLRSGRTPILLVHGLNVQLHTWDPLAAVLEQEWPVIALDLRGHGDSDWTREGYRVRQFVADLAGVADELELPAAHCIGHSLGARIGIAYAAEHPSRVASLVLSDTGPEVPHDGAKEVQRKVGKTGNVRSFRTAEDALAYYQELYPEWQPEFHELHVRHQLRRNWADKLVLKADPDMFWITGSVSLKEVDYLWDCAARIQAPTLVMRGARSYLLSAEIADRMAAVIPHSRVVTLETGHYIPREDPEGFLREVRGFLRDLG